MSQVRKHARHPAKNIGFNATFHRGMIRLRLGTEKSDEEGTREDFIKSFGPKLELTVNMPVSKIPIRDLSRFASGNMLLLKGIFFEKLKARNEIYI